METNKVLSSLIQNYSFRRAKESRLPSIDYVYPDFTADGNTEAFRFSENLRAELSQRNNVVRQGLHGRDLTWTTNENVLLEVGKIAPRIGLEEQITGKINSIYSYAPILFLGFSNEDVASYVVKPAITEEMAWFEFSAEEKENVAKLLERMANEKPYRNFLQRIFGGSIK